MTDSLSIAVYASASRVLMSFSEDIDRFFSKNSFDSSKEFSRLVMWNDEKQVIINLCTNKCYCCASLVIKILEITFPGGKKEAVLRPSLPK